MKTVTVFVTMSWLLCVTGHKPARVGCVFFKNETVNCRHKHLQTIPNNTLPDTTRKLDLSFNEITRIQSFTFRTLQSLVWLDLSRNKIHQLERHAFANLQKLKYLNLNSNDLLLSQDTYQPMVFLPLQNLETLHMEDNVCKRQVHDSSFPEAIATLKNLRELYTDLTTYVTFGKDFANLTKLEKISSAGREIPNKRHRLCCVKRMYNNTFEPFRNVKLKSFRLAHSCLRNIQLDVFDPLNYLQSLEIEGNRNLGLYKLLQTMHGLQNQTVDHVSFKGTNDFVKKRARDFYPNVLSTRYLSSMCVRYLDISNNFIFLADTIQFSKPECLEKFDMSMHLTSPHLIIAKLLNSKPFPNLRFLNVSTSEIPVSDSSMEKSVLSFHKSPLKFLLTLDLSYLPMSCNSYNEQFATLNVLNISGWNCTIAQPELFITMYNVTRLSVRKANLDAGLAWQYKKGSIFRNMSKLQVLDMSENQLISLPDDLFLPTQQLTSLTLENNKLTSIPQSIFTTTRITYLDLSRNVINYLTQDEIKLLENQKKKLKSFRLLLAANPFVCGCQSLEFLKWLNTSDIVSDYGPHYMCRMSNGSQIQIQEFMKTYKNFAVSCVSQLWLKIGIAVLFVTIPLIVLGVLYYRRRWNIHYWFYTNCKPTPDMLPERHFDYDAFVAYNHNDCEWVYQTLKVFLEDEQQGVRLCLHHRDFEVGEVIQQNIVDSINKSRKVILVISDNFVRSTWGEYEIEMASMRSVQEGRANVIVSIMLDQVPVRDMPRSLMNLWHRVTFLEWSDSPPEQALFWERLMEALR